jgi:glycosyltransferase involved in cell wall biosynthesis
MSASQRRDTKRYAVREKFKSRIISACDAALVGGATQKDYAVHLGMQEKSVFVGYDAVDNSHFTEGAIRARRQAAILRERHDLPQRYILASARFIPKKNLICLVQAFAESISMTHTSHSLVILGDGQDRSKIEAAISIAGIEDRVHLPGFKEYRILPIYFGLAEGFVHVSLAEQWGLVINEAAAAGLPLVVSKVCGAASELVVEGRNGALVDPLDQASIIQALSALMLASDGERQCQGAESLDIVSNWGPERFAVGLWSAASSAMENDARPLSIGERMLFRALSRYYISSTP